MLTVRKDIRLRIAENSNNSGSFEQNERIFLFPKEKKKMQALLVVLLSKALRNPGAFPVIVFISKEVSLFPWSTLYISTSRKGKMTKGRNTPYFVRHNLEAVHSSSCHSSLDKMK